jgi:hypothetical protein
MTGVEPTVQHHLPQFRGAGFGRNANRPSFPANRPADGSVRELTDPWNAPLKQRAFGGNRGNFGICAGVRPASFVSSASQWAIIHRRQKASSMIEPNQHLQIGSLLFEALDQVGLTGPFKVLFRIPNATLRIYAKSLEPVRDVRGLRLFADAELASAPPLDVLHIPGGFKMHDAVSG